MSKSIFSYFKKYSYLIGVFLFGIILLRIDLGAVFQNIKNIKLPYLILAVLLNIPILFIKAGCWNYIKKQQGMSYNLKDSFLMYSSGTYIGAFTPGRIGEFTKALYLKNDGHSLGVSLLTTILERLSDFVFLITFVFLGSLVFFKSIYEQIWIPLTIIFFLIAAFIIFLKTGLFNNILKKIFDIFIPQKYQESWKLNFQNFVNNIKVYKSKN